MSNIGVIGAGYWGKNLIRNFYELGALYAVCDSNEKILNTVKEKYKSIKLYTDYKKMLRNKKIDGVVIATPAGTHFKIARDVIRRDKNVFVEKPLATSYKESMKLIEMAEKRNLILMVGYTFLYNAAIEKIKELLNKKEIGDVYYIYSQRLNLGKIRSDTNVWWNLAPHDVSIILYLINKEPREVIGVGFSYIQDGIEDVVNASIRFEDNSSAFIQVSWLSPNKIRKMTIVGSKKMITYDDTSSDMKVQVYDKGIDKEHREYKLKEYEDFGQFQLIQRAGDIYIPKINFIEPLKKECAHFVECIREKKEPLTSGKNTINVMRVLEGVSKSIKYRGRLIKLEAL